MSLFTDFSFRDFSFFFTKPTQNETVKEKEVPVPTKYVFSDYFAPEKLTKAVKIVIRSLVFQNVSLNSDQLKEMKTHFPALRSVTFNSCKVNNKSTFKLRTVSAYLEDIVLQKF